MAAEPTAVATGGLESFFHFKKWNTSLTRDTIAGLTTFMVMSYIIFVNPSHPRSRREGTAVRRGADLHLPRGRRDDHHHGRLHQPRLRHRAGPGLNAVVAFSLVAGPAASPSPAPWASSSARASPSPCSCSPASARPSSRPSRWSSRRPSPWASASSSCSSVWWTAASSWSAAARPVTLGNLIGVPVAVTIFGLVVMIIMLTLRWRGRRHPRHPLLDHARHHPQLRLPQDRRSRQAPP